MKKKILLAGGKAPFVGPRVNLELGSWLVEPPPNSVVQIMLPDGEVVELQDEPYMIIGPINVQAIVKEAKQEVHMDAIQVSTA